MPTTTRSRQPSSSFQTTASPVDISSTNAASTMTPPPPGAGPDLSPTTRSTASGVRLRSSTPAHETSSNLGATPSMQISPIERRPGVSTRGSTAIADAAPQALTAHYTNAGSSAVPLPTSTTTTTTTGIHPPISSSFASAVATFHSTSELSPDDYNVCLSILHGLQRHSDSGPFLFPLNPKDWSVDESVYRSIENPIDLGTIEKKLSGVSGGENEGYATVQEFLDDLLLMFRNCLKLWKESDPVWKMAKALEDFLGWQIGKLGEGMTYKWALPRVMVSSGKIAPKKGKTGHSSPETAAPVASITSDLVIQGVDSHGYAAPGSLGKRFREDVLTPVGKSASQPRKRRNSASLDEQGGIVGLDSRGSLEGGLTTGGVNVGEVAVPASVAGVSKKKRDSKKDGESSRKALKNVEMLVPEGDGGVDGGFADEGTSLVSGKEAVVGDVGTTSNTGKASKTSRSRRQSVALSTTTLAAIPEVQRQESQEYQQSQNLGMGGPLGLGHTAMIHSAFGQVSSPIPSGLNVIPAVTPGTPQNTAGTNNSNNNSNTPSGNPPSTRRGRGRPRKESYSASAPPPNVAGVIPPQSEPNTDVGAAREVLGEGGGDRSGIGMAHGQQSLSGDGLLMSNDLLKGTLGKTAWVNDNGGELVVDPDMMKTDVEKNMPSSDNASVSEMTSVPSTGVPNSDVRILPEGVAPAAENPIRSLGAMLSESSWGGKEETSREKVEEGTDGNVEDVTKEANQQAGNSISSAPALVSTETADGAEALLSLAMGCIDGDVEMDGANSQLLPAGLIPIVVTSEASSSTPIAGPDMLEVPTTTARDDDVVTSENASQDMKVDVAIDEPTSDLTKESAATEMEGVIVGHIADHVALRSEAPSPWSDAPLAPILQSSSPGPPPYQPNAATEVAENSDAPAIQQQQQPDSTLVTDATGSSGFESTKPAANESILSDSGGSETHALESPTKMEVVIPIPKPSPDMQEEESLPSAMPAADSASVSSSHTECTQDSECKIEVVIPIARHSSPEASEPSPLPAATTATSSTIKPAIAGPRIKLVSRSRDPSSTPLVLATSKPIEIGVDLSNPGSGSAASPNAIFPQGPTSYGPYPEVTGNGNDMFAGEGPFLKPRGSRPGGLGLVKGRRNSNQGALVHNTRSATVGSTASMSVFMNLQQQAAAQVAAGAPSPVGPAYFTRGGEGLGLGLVQGGGGGGELYPGMYTGAGTPSARPGGKRNGGRGTKKAIRGPAKMAAAATLPSTMAFQTPLSSPSLLFGSPGWAPLQGGVSLVDSADLVAKLLGAPDAATALAGATSPSELLGAPARTAYMASALDMIPTTALPTLAAGMRRIVGDSPPLSGNGVRTRADGERGSKGAGSLGVGKGIGLTVPKSSANAVVGGGDDSGIEFEVDFGALSSREWEEVCHLITGISMGIP
ncbi:hypothetical protein HDU76_011908 [Blyttiomyces sp. JEL0837]|nr:hypothetical protein HDU76_011908 [Blyttiomyces sp. JEL0837]